MAYFGLRYAVFALLIAGTAFHARAEPKEDLVIGITQFPSSLHPYGSSQLIQSYVDFAARRRSARFDAQGKMMCQLCTEMPSIENGRAKLVDETDGTKTLEVTFTLRDGLKWGDGSPLTTKDILFGAEVERLFSLTANLVGVVAVDDRSYTVKLSPPRWDFDRLSPAPINAAIEEPILRAAKDPLDYIAKSAYSRAPVTPGLWNGPYLLTEFKSNDTIGFSQNPYWVGPKPAFQHLIMRFIDNTAALQANLLSGDVDLPYGLSLDQAIDLQKRYADRFDISFEPSLSVTSLYLQTENPLLADKRIRQAMMLGIDRQTIVERLFGGKLPVANSFMALSDQANDKQLKPWPYDPARGRALLVEAGYSAGSDGIMVGRGGARLSIDLLVTAGNRAAELLQQVIQSQLKQIGIEVKATSAPDRVLNDTWHKRLFTGMVLRDWTENPGQVPYRVYGSASIPRESNNWNGYDVTGYINPRLDAILQPALGELNSVKRQAVLDETQTAVMEDLPLLPLYNGVNTFISPKWMAGLTPPRSISVPTLWVEFWRPK